MIVESQSSDLKRFYPMKFNKSQLDFLLHVIAVKVAPKYTNEFPIISYSLQKSHWFK